MAARGAAVVGAVAHRAEDLGGQHDVLAANAEVLQRLTDDALAAAETVDVGGIDEVDACFQGDFDQLIGLLLLQAADQAPDVVVAAEGHGAQAQSETNRPSCRACGNQTLGGIEAR